MANVKESNIKLWKGIKGLFGIKDEGALQAAPMPQQAAPMQAKPAVPSAIGQALAQRPGEISPRAGAGGIPSALVPSPIGIPPMPERLGDETKVGFGELALAKTLGPTSPTARIGTALATDPTVQAQVGQLAMALGAKSPRGVGYQLGQSIVKEAEGKQYQMLQTYFSDVIAGRQPSTDMDLENLTLSPELRAKAFNDTLVQALGGARVEYFEAGAERQRAEAEHIRRETPEVIAERERLEDIEQEETRLARQAESRQQSFDVSAPGRLHDLMREKIAFETGEKFWQGMGMEPPGILVKWSEEKEQNLQELFARTGLDPDLDVTDDTAIETYIQSLIDQGLTEPEAFEYLMEMGIK